MIYFESYRETTPVHDVSTVDVRLVATSREELAEIRGALFELGRREGWRGVPGEVRPT